jgi:hypothetical protein
MSDPKEFTIRTVVKRDEVNQKMVDAAKVMPGNADPEMPSDPKETPEAGAANESVGGIPGAPGKLPGTTFGKGGRG